jgi:hypothetical protein
MNTLRWCKRALSLIGLLCLIKVNIIHMLFAQPTPALTRSWSKSSCTPLEKADILLEYLRSSRETCRRQVMRSTLVNTIHSTQPWRIAMLDVSMTQTGVEVRRLYIASSHMVESIPNLMRPAHVCAYHKSIIDEEGQLYLVESWRYPLESVSSKQAIPRRIYLAHSLYHTEYIHIRVDPLLANHKQWTFFTHGRSPSLQLNGDKSLEAFGIMIPAEAKHQRESAVVWRVN